ncbi:MAG: hypothetical protein QOK34_430, partial [Gaiellaceae bacterium]|nr:hypothetical protein [Gaiellaceae bacterium]
MQKVVGSSPIIRLIVVGPLCAWVGTASELTRNVRRG